MFRFAQHDTPFILLIAPQISILGRGPEGSSVGLLRKKSGATKEIGAPDFRINCPFGLVLTPWDNDL
jgi:hypothetical protein